MGAAVPSRPYANNDTTLCPIIVAVCQPNLASNLPASVVFGFFSPPSSPTHPKSTSTSASASASASTPTAHANIPLSGISDKFYSTRSLYASCEDHLPRAPAIVDFHCQPQTPRFLMARQQSLDSQRPIMAPSRNSQRFSTISATGSLALSDHTVSSTMTGDSRLAEIKELGAGLERLENKPLTKQRFVPTPEKTDNLNKLALGAKVERALGRRMSSQDAIMRKRTPIDEEKEALKMQAGS
ncbi:hypothetical protein BDFG_01513 [Blastomyces dermatitidis ATCC 26199]|nr:hypothetical protein BDFG_01513 [Blastomyces dermatitidis ATCC 26199]